MQLSRARRLSSASTVHQGACLMSVWRNISSFWFAGGFVALARIFGMHCWLSSDPSQQLPARANAESTTRRAPFLAEGRVPGMTAVGPYSWRLSIVGLTQAAHFSSEQVQALRGIGPGDGGDPAAAEFALALVSVGQGRGRLRKPVTHAQRGALLLSSSNQLSTSTTRPSSVPKRRTKMNDRSSGLTA